MSVFTPFAFQGSQGQGRTAFNFVTGSTSNDTGVIFVAFTPYFPFPSVYMDDEDLSLATAIYAGSTGTTLNPNSFYISNVDFCKGQLDQSIYRYWNGSTLSSPTVFINLFYSTYYNASLCSGGGSTIVQYAPGSSPAATGYSKCYLPPGTSVKVAGSTSCYTITSLYQPNGSAPSAPVITNIYTNCASCP
jgi:hypothetical protein